VSVRVGRRTIVVGVAVVLVLLVAAGVLVWSRLSTTPFEEAVERLPSGVMRAAYTDWDAVEGSVPGSDLSASSSAEDMDAFLARAFDKDLTTASALSDSFVGLAENYDITPLDATWEIYGQAEDGAVDVLKLSEDVDLDALEERFEEMGYEPPSDGAGSDGVWEGTPELVAGLDEPLTSLQMNVAVVTSERLLLMGDLPSYLRTAISVIKGESDSLASVDGVPELVDTADRTTVALMWVGDFACADLAMSQADPTDTSEGEGLVEEAGGVHPLNGLVMAQQSDSTMAVGMVFETSDQASDDLQPRTELASGPAPGQGGTFSERFRVTDSVAEDRVVKMTFDPANGTLLGDLGQGPVLFATC
jgi:hypothetical protein